MWPLSQEPSFPSGQHSTPFPHLYGVALAGLAEPGQHTCPPPGSLHISPYVAKPLLLSVHGGWASLGPVTQGLPASFPSDSSALLSSLLCVPVPVTG